MPVSPAWCDHTLVNLTNGRAAEIPAWVVEKYSVGRKRSKAFAAFAPRTRTHKAATAS